MDHSVYMKRALELAARGTKFVKSNPKVGAVLVYQNRILGEGYHQKYGEGHAEVNCIKSVKKVDHHLIEKSTIYITLEPCFHTGKTPPCVDLIIKNKIQNVVIGTLDPNPKVGGQSIEKLKSLNINVTVGILEKECKQIIQPFIKMMNKKPWVILKFAKSKYNYMASDNGQVWLSSQSSKLLVHNMRANVDGIMIGTNTAATDNPALTTRLVDGDNPIRIVLDREGKLDKSLTLFTDELTTIYVTSTKRDLPDNVNVLIHNFDAENHMDNLMGRIYELGIYRLMIEGGAALLKSVVKNNSWDEAVVISTRHELNEGKLAPNINGKLLSKIECDGDTVYTILKQ